MTLKRTILTLGLLLGIAGATPASASLKFGLVGGLNLSKMSVSGGGKAMFSSDNRSGWYVGPKAEFTIPLIGLGADVSAQYSQRRLNLAGADGTSQTYKSIEVPVNVRYTLGFSSLIAAYISTGPQFGFNCDKSVLRDQGFDVKDTNITWNVGLGLTLFSHLQVGAGYNFALGDWAERAADDVKLKANSWQVQVAYLF